jgi:hypothetical protein
MMIATEKTAAPEFVLKFDGEPSELSTSTFLPSLLAVSGIISELNSHLAPETRFDLKIRAPQRGSFIVQLALSPADLAAVASSLFTVNNLKLALELIAAFSGLLTIRKHLKKEKPRQVFDEGGNVIVTNAEGRTVTVGRDTFNLSQTNVTINLQVDRVFKTLASDTALRGFEVKDASNQTLFEARQHEFSDLAPGALTSTDQPRLTVERATLSIVKVSFEPKLRWQLIYHGTRIGAYVTDAEFLDRIDQKDEAFGKGDTLDADLQVEQVWDSSLNTYLNKTYYVVKVYNHTRYGRQAGLDLSGT